MEYNKIVAVSGLSGLFELVSSKTDGAIVRSLDDKTTKFASSRVHQFSLLENIEIYTIKDNVNMVEVFQTMSKSEKTLPDAKDEKAVKAYFQEVYPDMDFDRVYMSDMKKMVKWHDILVKNNIEIKLAEPEEEAATVEAAEEVAEKPIVKKSKKPSKKEDKES